MRELLGNKSDVTGLRDLLLLFGIFLLALFLRTYNLSGVPVGLHVDEVNAGYVGRYIFLHGHDIFGNVLPLYFDKFGDFRPTGIFYLSGISTFIFGINSFAIRFPSAFFGALSVFAIYFLAIEIFNRRVVGMFAALVLALIPWHIVLSRSTSESVIGLFFFIFALYFLFKFLHTQKKSFLVYSCIAFFITYFFYHIFRVMIPIFLLFFLVQRLTTSSTWKESRSSPSQTWLPQGHRSRCLNYHKFGLVKYIFLGLVFFGALTMLFAFQGFGSGRFSQVAFYKNEEPVQILDYFSKRDTFKNILLTRVFHNKPVVYAREFLKQYGSYYHFDYLFGGGGLPDRYRVPQVGLMPFVWGVLIFIGFIALARNSQQKETFLFLVFSFLIAPFPAALTFEDTPNIQRSMLLMVPFVLLAAYGFSELANIRKRVLALLIILIFVTFNVYEEAYFWHQYMEHTKDYKLYTRSEGQRELVFSLLTRKQDYKKIVVPIYQEIPALYLYYTKNFSTSVETILRKNNKLAVIDGIIFVDSSCPSREFSRLGISEKSILIVDSIECERDLNSQFQEAGFVTFQNGDKAYRLLNYRSN